MASSEFGSEKWRMRPSAIVALPENTGSYSGPSTAATSSARPEPRTRRGRSPAGCRGWRRPTRAARSAGRAARCVPPTSSCVSSPTSCRSSTRTTCWSSASRIGAALRMRVVEQPHVDAVDGARRPAGDRRRPARPTTRIDPLATAVVYGDSFGTNSRTYGSSELSWKRNVSSASACGGQARSGRCR